MTAALSKIVRHDGLAIGAGLTHLLVLVAEAWAIVMLLFGTGFFEAGEAAVLGGILSGHIALGAAPLTASFLAARHPHGSPTRRRRLAFAAATAVSWVLVPTGFCVVAGSFSGALFFGLWGLPGLVFAGQRVARILHEQEECAAPAIARRPARSAQGVSA